MAKKSMTYLDTLKQAIELLKLDKGAATQLASSEQATTHAFITIALASLAAAIGMLNPFTAIPHLIGSIVISLFMIVLMHFIAKLFGGKATLTQYFRVIGNAMVLGWLYVIPFIGFILAPLIGIWMIVVNVVTLQQVHKLDMVKSIVVTLIPVIIALILAFIIGTILVAIGLTALSAMFFSGAMTP